MRTSGLLLWERLVPLFRVACMVGAICCYGKTKVSRIIAGKDFHVIEWRSNHLYFHWTLIRCNINFTHWLGSLFVSALLHSLCISLLQTGSSIRLVGKLMLVTEDQMLCCDVPIHVCVICIKTWGSVLIAVNSIRCHPHHYRGYIVIVIWSANKVDIHFAYWLLCLVGGIALVGRVLPDCLDKLCQIYQNASDGFLLMLSSQLSPMGIFSAF